MDSLERSNILVKAEKDIQNILNELEQKAKIKVVALRITETDCYYPDFQTHIPTRSIEILYDRIDQRWAE
jgi:hypothetical protein